MIRVDPFTGLRSLIAPGRLERPGGALHVPPPAAVDEAGDPFALGAEEQTPPELDRTSAPLAAGWAARAFPNLHPAVTPGAPAPPVDAAPDLFAEQAAEGAHEVLVSSARPVASHADLSPAELALAVELWQRRMRAHAGAAALHLTFNEGAGSGSSQPHVHAQLYALPFVPADLARERERFSAHASRTMGGNLLGDLVQEEVRRRVRLVAYDDEAVLLAAWAPRQPYQLVLAPRTPAPRWQDEGTPNGAALLHDALQRLTRRFGHTPPLSAWVRTAPRGAEHYSWRIDLLPRLAPLGGLELGTGLAVCPVAPEQAAAELKAA